MNNSKNIKTVRIELYYIEICNCYN